MLRKIIPIFMIAILWLGAHMAHSGDMFRKNYTPEEPAVILGMTVEQVTLAFKERGFPEITDKKTLKNGEGNLVYGFVPRKDATPIHPSWVGSYFQLNFSKGKLANINWYKKDWSPLALNKQKLYLGPK